MIFSEIINVLKEQKVDPNDLFYDYNLPTCLGPITIVERIGGLEGEGEYAHSILNFEDHGVFIKITGVYYSYNGIEFFEELSECCEQVWPVEKTITVYQNEEGKFNRGVLYGP